MCGFAGATGPRAGGVDTERVDAALAHRGPDGAGVWRSGDCVLVHRRLAILDPDPRADQPMALAGRQGAVVYNGEIYNYPALRAEFGRSLTTGCDTELLAAGETSDPGLWRSFRGMFAAAVADETSEGRFTLRFARDPFGIKPLYRMEDARGQVFASEIRSLIAVAPEATEIDAGALAGYLAYGCVPGSRAIISGVRRHDPGVLETVLPGDRSSGDWAPGGDGVQRASISATGAALSLRDALEDSVRAHLLSDVPVGLFLSGGVDSSAIAAAAPKEADLVAITLRAAEGSVDESDTAARTAARYGLEHLVVDISEEDCLAAVHEYLAVMDSPTVDGLNSYLVSKAARSLGIKVCLSGSGGDEVFGGYPVVRTLRLLTALRILPPPARRALAAAGEAGTATRKRRRLAAALRAPDRPALADLAHRSLLDHEVAELMPGAVMPHAPSAPLPQREMEGYLRSVLLADADVFGMANGVEIRVPFVDREVVAAAAAIPYWRHEARRKRMLTRALGDPHLEELRRSPKLGFSLPIAQWLAGPLASLVSRLGQGPPACLEDLVDGGAFAAVARRWAAGDPGDFLPVWQAAVLYAWGDRHDRRA